MAIVYVQILLKSHSQAYWGIFGDDLACIKGMLGLVFPKIKGTDSFLTFFNFCKAQNLHDPTVIIEPTALSSLF